MPATFPYWVTVPSPVQDGTAEFFLLFKVSCLSLTQPSYSCNS